MGALQLGAWVILAARAAQAYTAGPPLNYTHVDCYEDTTLHALDGQIKADLGANGDSPYNCAQTCSNLGYEFSGVEDGTYVSAYRDDTTRS